MLHESYSQWLSRSENCIKWDNAIFQGYLIGYRILRRMGNKWASRSVRGRFSLRARWALRSISPTHLPCLFCISVRPVWSRRVRPTTSQNGRASSSRQSKSRSTIWRRSGRRRRWCWPRTRSKWCSASNCPRSLSSPTSCVGQTSKNIGPTFAKSTSTDIRLFGPNVQVSFQSIFQHTLSSEVFFLIFGPTAKVAFNRIFG